MFMDWMAGYGQFMVLQGTGVYDNVRVGGASD